MKEIKLLKGLVAEVDDCFEYLNQYIWNLHNGYAARSETLTSGRTVTIYMHREIMNFPRGFDVDHINGKRLDNQRANLRPVTKQQNQFNRGAVKGTTSQFKGVSWFSKKNLWRACIRIDKKFSHIGLFSFEIEAAAAYNAMALKHHGEYARLNDVPEVSDWMMRRAFKRSGESTFRGVSLHKAPDKWKASISYRNKRIHIGIFKSELEAATAYNLKALELLGDKAVLNPLEALAL